MWTPEEEIFLKENWDCLTRKVLKEKLNKTIHEIYAKARGIGLEINNILANNAKTKRWNKEEIKFLEENYCEIDINELANKLGRTTQSIKEKTCSLGIQKEFRWTKEEDDILIKNISNYSYKDIEKLLPNRTFQSIKLHARWLGLKRIIIPMWSKEEEEILIKNYPHKTAEELICLFPNKEKYQIKVRARKLKLRKTDETLERIYHMPVKEIRFHNTITIWRKAVLKRDNFCCKECSFEDKKGGQLNAHHIIPVRDPKCNKYDVNNGICLCIDCHVKIHGKEYEFADKFKKLIGD